MDRASLNHTFRVIWNEVTQTWVAVSEITRGKGKSKAVAAAVASVLVAASGVAQGQPANQVYEFIDNADGTYNLYADEILVDENVSSSEANRVDGTALTVTDMPFGGSVTNVDANIYVGDGEDASGILVLGGLYDYGGEIAGGLITNNGLIDVLTDSALSTGESLYTYASGILVEGEVAPGSTIQNSLGASINAVSKSATGTAYAEGIGAGGLYGSVLNMGSISASAQGLSGAEAAGIYVNYFDSYYGATIVNDGTLSAVATSTQGTANAAGIMVAYSYSYPYYSGASIVNDGTLSATSTSTEGDANAAGIQYGNVLYGRIYNGAPAGEMEPTSTSAASIEALATTSGEDASALAVGISVGYNGEMMPFGMGGTEAIGEDSAVYNNGSIVAEATQNNLSASGLKQVAAAGIELKGGVKMGGVVQNSGTIGVTSTSKSSNVSAIGVGVSVGVDLDTVVNTDSGNAWYPLLDNNYSVIEGQLVNSGSIDVSSSVPNTAPYDMGNYTRAMSFGVLTGNIYGEYADFINGETGSIHASSDGGFAAAVGVSVNGGILAAVDGIGEYGAGLGYGADFSNAGSITAEASSLYQAVATGVTIGTVGSGSVVSNAGTIGAVASSESGEDISLATGISVGQHDGDLINSGTVAASLASGSDKVGFDNSLMIQNGVGAVHNTVTGRLIGGVKVGSTGNFVNDGEIVLKSGVDLNDVNNTGRPTMGRIAGDYIQGEDGTLHIAAAGANYSLPDARIYAPIVEFSRLQVEGEAVLLPGASAHVDVKQLNTLAVGQTLEGVVETNYGVYGNFAQVTDDSALLRFNSVRVDGGTGSIVDGESYANRIDFQIESDRTVTDTVVENTNPSGVGAAGLFDLLIAGGGNEAMQPIISVFNQEETTRGVSDLVSQTLPLLQGGSGLVTMGSIMGVNRVVQARQEGQLGRSSGDAFIGDRKVWLKPMGSWSDQKNRDGFAGYDSRTFGFVLGVDALTTDTQRVGMAFAWSDGRVDSNNALAPQRAEVNNYQLVFYGSNSWSEATDISYQLSVGHHYTQGARSVNILGVDQVAQSKYSSSSLHVGVGLAHTLKLNEQTDFTPSVRADYMTVRDNGYSESGAGPLDLNVASNRAENMRLSTDAKFTYRSSPVTTLTANAGVSYDVINDRPSVVASFAGAPGLSFTTSGLKPSSWAVNLGAGVIKQLNDGMQLTGRLDVESRKGFTNTTASVKMRWSW